MRNLFKKIKSNNKGDTLAIVLIGIVLLAMLGTVILNVTSVNFRMKLSEMQSKKNFYYCEAALDEIYAGIGGQVSKAMEEAYKDSMEKLVGKKGNTLTSKSGADSTTNFKNVYYKELHDTYGYKSGADLNAMKTRFQGYIKSSFSNVTITVEGIDSIDDSVAGKIVIKGVKVSSETNAGYYANIKTDLVIDTPNVALDFIDSGTKDYGELFEYAIVAGGNKIVNSSNSTNWVNHAALTVSGNGKVDINGNVYAGSNIDNGEYFAENITDSSPKDSNGYYIVDKKGTSSRKNAIEIGGADVTIKAKNVVANGSIVTGQYSYDRGQGINKAGNSKLTMTGSSDYLNVWARNIEVEGNSDQINIDGNCAVADDLEINGDGDTVNITGSYFGYGFDGDTATGVEANTSDKTGDSTKYANGALYEHEKRSAVIINGKDANLFLTDDNDDKNGNSRLLLLGGRSYIDLTGRSAVDSNSSTYMTGESISFRGNQDVYLAELAGLGNNISSNPAKYEPAMVDTSTGLFNYSYLGIPNTDNIIAKWYGGDSVFFYNYQVNPKLQSEYIANRYNNDADVRNLIQNMANKLKINNVKIGNTTRTYSVGTVMGVTNGTLASGSSIAPSETDFTQSQFCDIVNDLNRRFKLLNTTMQDDRSKYIGYDYITTTANNTYKSPFDYYVDGTSFAGTKVTQQNIQKDSNAIAIGMQPFTDDELAKVGITNRDTTNIGYQIYDTPVNIDNAGGEIKQVEIDRGIVISSGNIKITKDFTGLIICGGDVIVEAPIGRTITLKSDKELATMIADKSPAVAAALKGYVPGSSATSGAGAVNIDDVTYDSVITYQNWEKNAN